MIVSPPVVMVLPAASRAFMVSVTTFADETVPEDTLTKDVDVLIAPSVTATPGIVEVTFEPPTVAVIVVAVPLRAPVKLES